MPKREATDNGKIGNDKRPRFPQAAQLADIFKEMDSGMIVRDNTQFLAHMSKLTLFTRPTQLGKSTFLALAELVDSKGEKSPTNIAKNVPEDHRNAGYVIRFDFLKVFFPRTNRSWHEDLTSIDSKFLSYIKRSITRYLKKNKELKAYYIDLESESELLAGDYLDRLSEAVKDYSEEQGTKEFFMILVDEYDQPLRDTLFELLLDQPCKEDVVKFCPNYVSFFSILKSVGQISGNSVWVTGVVPIALDLISNFKAENMTFNDLDMVPPKDWDDEDGYGDNRALYRATKNSNLLNLGSSENREFIRRNILPISKDQLIDPDEQYSCHARNLEFHQALMNSNILSEFDGTIITSHLCDDEDLEGAEEVVLVRRSYDKISLKHFC
eukprot:CAMPEP_0178932474 /NCGR_PEP_ID=MMETSP0786-20121207/22631_1 /TAXON_ID=186022 /ORGANISM="Thalassionema frauenfeldii, Strain CCMP 1798" /LENGTH=381 /DNA_ID=CAMNT_0020609757 /DNA_START=188 /DNA_END=1335 /DNA_ORIENTATION=-